MKNLFTKNKKVILAFFLSFFLMGGNVVAQSKVIFSENMGNPSETTPISANIFQNDGILTFTGTADVRSTTVSPVASGFSGGGNVFFTAIDRYFIISGIDTSEYKDLELSFGLWRSTASQMNSAYFLVEVATDFDAATGIGTFTALTVESFTTTPAWRFINVLDGYNIPSSENLAIRFTHRHQPIDPGVPNPQFRLDDVVLTGTPIGLYVISEWRGLASHDNGNFLATAGIAANNNTAVLTRGDNNGTNWGFGVASAGTVGFATSGTWSVGDYWMAEFSTIGFENLTLSSVQRSTNTAPRNFRVDFRIGSIGEWTAVENGNIVVGNDVLTGVLNELPLPEAMRNQESVYLRWIVSEPYNVNGAALTPFGTAVNSLRATILGFEITPSPTVVIDHCGDVEFEEISEGVYKLNFSEFAITAATTRTIHIWGDDLGYSLENISHPIDEPFMIVSGLIARSGEGADLSLPIAFVPQEDFAEHTAELTITSGGIPVAVIALAATAGDITTDIQEVTITRFIYARDGHIRFSATAGETVQIHNVLGQLIHSGIATEGTNSVAVSPGIMLVRIGNEVNKIVVR